MVEDGWGQTYDSYSDPQRSVPEDDFLYGGWVYFEGSGFVPKADYNIGYYDANDSLVISGEIKASPTGVLSSQIKLNTTSAGVWHAVVFEVTTDPPLTYDAIISFVVEDDFNVNDPSLWVELSHFLAFVSSCGIVLHWRTEIEVDVFEWRIERSEIKDVHMDEDGEYTRIATVKAEGGGEYYYTDTEVELTVTYYYRLGEVSHNGDVRWYGPVSITAWDMMPNKVEISASPNSFHSFAVIRYSLLATPL